jgi:hypothetical protein
MNKTHVRPYLVPEAVTVIICADGTSRWRSTVTRCDVFVDCRQEPGFFCSGVSKPHRWGTWWALDGNDTKDTLTTLIPFYTKGPLDCPLFVR